MRFIYFVLSLILINGGLTAQTFSGQIGLIPDDLSTIVFTADVTGLPNTTDTLNFGIEQVCFSITHTYDSDLTIRLKSPGGKVVTLIESVGGDQDNFTETCFNATASGSIFSGGGPFTGIWRPVGDLGIFNDGTDPNGTWELIIRDVYPADQGDLLSWTIQFGANPAKPYTFTASHLPIVKIETNNATIVDDPKISGIMHIISNDQDQDNLVSDTNYSFSGPIGIELRGSSSQSFPKKSYGMETQDDTGEDLDVSLLNMPEESDWILNAHYSDKTLIRNNMTFELSRRMGHYAPRTALCELFLNGEYKGIYSLMEKVKRNKNRVDISKLTPEDNDSSAVTGGYIFKVDRATGSGSAGWGSQYSAPNNDNYFPFFLFEYPSEAVITFKQQEYLSNFVDSFENALHGPDFQDAEIGWRHYGDENSFIDFMLLQELSKNVDAYRLSTFLTKNKDTKDNKIHFGPVWDFDLGWLNADYCFANDPSGWAWEINYKCPDGGVPFWWERALEDTTFRQNMRCRWEVLRSTTLSQDSIFRVIDEMVAKMHGADVHNFHAWAILGVYVWPNPQPIPSTYEGEINKLKKWITDRFKWLDYIINTRSNDLKVSFTTDHVDGLNWSFTPDVILEGSYHWDFGDGKTSDEVSPEHVYATVGTYDVVLTLTHKFGCTAASDQIINIVNLKKNSAEALQIELYPNPAADLLNIKVDKNAKDLRLEITDLNGKVVYNKNRFVDGANALDISGLIAGVYFCNLIVNDQVAKVKLVHLD